MIPRFFAAACVLGLSGLMQAAIGIEVFPEAQWSASSVPSGVAQTANSRRFSTQLLELAPEVEHFSLSTADSASIRRFNRRLQPGRPPRTGIVKPADINVELQAAATHNGVTRVLEHTGRGQSALSASGELVWTMRLDIANAFASRLEIRGLELPAGAEMYLYNEHGELKGPYDGRRSDFWTHSIRGQKLGLQIRLDATTDFAGTLPSFQIAHILLLDSSAQSLCVNNADCLEDATCFGSDDWPGIEHARRGVAGINFVKAGSSYLCSAGLLADTDQATQIPYLITANHCVDSGSVAATVEATFLYATERCGGPCVAPSGPTVLGATLLNASPDTDHSLMQLAERPSGDVTYLGWSATPVAAQHARVLYRLSHPKGAPQAFSSQTVDVGAPTCNGFPRGRFVYSRDLVGATEGGSSGSPLLTSTAQVVGHLFGVCGTNVGDACDAFSNATVDGAFSSYFPSLAQWLDPPVASQPIWVPDQPARTHLAPLWTSVAAVTGYRAPIVIAGPPSFNGGDPGLVRLRNVGPTGFEIRFQEWNNRWRQYRDGAHAPEDVPYLVTEAGRHQQPDGTLIEAGTVSLDGTNRWQPVSFQTAFPGVPFVFLTVQTFNGGDAVIARVRNPTAVGFEAALFEEEALMNGHAVEAVGYLALWAPDNGVGTLIASGEPVGYRAASAEIDHRWASVLGRLIKLEEEQSLDVETRHAKELIHALMVGDFLFAQQVSHRGGDPTALRQR